MKQRPKYSQKPVQLWSSPEPPRPAQLELGVGKEIGGHAMACDVSDQAQVQTMFAQALQITGQIDILLNNGMARANCARGEGGYGGLDPMHEHQPSGREAYCLQEAAGYGGTEVWLNHQYVFSDGHSSTSNAIRLCRQ